MSALALPNPADIDRSSPEALSVMVTGALEQSKSWIELAMRETDPTPIAEFKRWAATLEEAVKQKRLSKDIQLDATEMVRRAERGVGVAIRNGQAAGTVANKGSGNKRRWDESLDQIFVRDIEPNGQTLQDERELASADDETFEEAIAESREEQDLSRANVKRKVKGIKNGETAADRRAKIKELAEQGYNSHQIGEQIGVLPVTVRKIGRDHGIEIPADTLAGKSRKKHDSNRVLSELVASVEGACMGIDLIDVDAISDADRDYYADALTKAIRQLAALKKGLAR